MFGFEFGLNWQTAILIIITLLIAAHLTGNSPYKYMISLTKAESYAGRARVGGIGGI